MMGILNLKLMILLLVFVFHYSPINLFTSNDNEVDLRISYIGNMGVLLESKDQTVLIDGFHEKYKAAYEFPSSEVVNSLIDGKYQEFTQLELSLFTHAHRDHFSPRLTLNYLKSNPESIVVGPEQVRGELEKSNDYSDSLLEQVRMIKSDNEIHTIQHEGILVKSINCGHTYQAKHRAIQNLSYLVDINGYKILHVGDAEWEVSKGALEKLNLLAISVDVAILPVWMLMEKSSIAKVSELINPGIVVAGHIDPNYANQTIEEVQQYFPGAVCLSRLNETLKFQKRR